MVITGSSLYLFLSSVIEVRPNAGGMVGCNCRLTQELQCISITADRCNNAISMTLPGPSRTKASNSAS